MKSALLALLPLLAAAPQGVFEVFDGPGLDADFVPAGGVIEANWSDVGAEEYRWAIGTSPGGEELQAFTSVGTSTVATSTVAAAAGTLYYVTVKVFVSGLEVDSDISDGVTGLGSPAAAAIPTSGAAPLTVNFLCQLQGVVLYEWDFDAPAGGALKREARSITPPAGPAAVDFSSPTSGNASFTYTFAGSYEARLTLHHQGGEITSDTLFIDVSPAPDAPVVGATSDVSNGPAPLTVTFTSTVSAEVGAYFWDFNLDGVYDASTDGPTLTHTFTAPGTYDVTSTVFSADGVGAMSSLLTITVDPPATGDVPTISSGMAIGSIFRVGDVVTFGASGGAGATGTITGYHWDFDGNGEVDLITPAGTASWRFTAPGFFNGSVRVSDSENLSSDPFPLGIQVDLANDQARVWLVEPESQLKVFGNFVSLTAVAVPADQVTGVDFFYRAVGANPWIPINLTPVLPPPTTEFGTHWDVTALPQGAPGFELKATATFATGPVDSPLIVVTVDAAAPDLLENSGSPFTKLKVQGVNPNAAANVGISRDTTLQLQAGSTASYDQMRMERRSENPHPVESALQGLRFVPGHFRRKSFASGQKLKKPSKLTMYLNTGGSDILADGTDLTKAAFMIMKFNEKDLRWEPLYNQTFNPSQKLLKAFAATTGDVAIAVVSNRTASSSSSASCGLLGLELVLAGVAAAALARRLRRGT